MIRSLLLLAMLTALALPAGAQEMRMHEEDKFGTTALVPEDWEQLPADSRWDGTRFMSPDGQAWVAVWGAAPADASRREYMRAISEIPGERITYRRSGRGWIVVSGYKGDRIFYRKALLACRGKVWHNVALEYPADRKRAYDRMVTAVSRSLDRGDC